MSLRTGKSSSEGVDLVIDGGLKKKVLKEGIGLPIGDAKVNVTVNYTGRLTDGFEFDSSKRLNKPFKFNLGQREVILGWDLGVKSMKKGEICLLTCKPDYGYGSAGAGSIPPNATLIFEVELISWTDETEDDSTDWLGYAIYLLGAFALLAAYYMYNKKVLNK